MFHFRLTAVTDTLHADLHVFLHACVSVTC